MKNIIFSISRINVRHNSAMFYEKLRICWKNLKTRILDLVKIPSIMSINEFNNSSLAKNNICKLENIGSGLYLKNINNNHTICGFSGSKGMFDICGIVQIKGIKPTSNPAHIEVFSKALDMIQSKELGWHNSRIIGKTLFCFHKLYNDSYKENNTEECQEVEFLKNIGFEFLSKYKNMNYEKTVKNRGVFMRSS